MSTVLQQRARSITSGFRPVAHHQMATADCGELVSAAEPAEEEEEEEEEAEKIEIGGVEVAPGELAIGGGVFFMILLLFILAVS